MLRPDGELCGSSVLRSLGGGVVLKLKPLGIIYEVFCTSLQDTFIY